MLTKDDIIIAAKWRSKNKEKHVAFHKCENGTWRTNKDVIRKIMRKKK